MSAKILKSIWAILAGFLVVVILSVATDMILEFLGIFPPLTTGVFTTWMVLLALLYRSAYTILGGYITAYIAPENKERHAFILGCIGIVAGTAGAIANWDKPPHWYPILLVVEALPLTYFGGKLYGVGS